MIFVNYTKSASQQNYIYNSIFLNLIELDIPSKNIVVLHLYFTTNKELSFVNIHNMLLEIIDTNHKPKKQTHKSKSSEAQIRINE